MPTDASRVVHRNPVRNLDRFAMYAAILQAGEPVPPILVDPLGDNFYISDGNHRTFAARQVGVEWLAGLVVTD